MARVGRNGERNGRLGASFSGVLSRELLLELVAGDPPLVSGWTDLDQQIQPNGFDLTLSEVRRHRGRGTIGISNETRILPDLDPLAPDGDGFLDLDPGIYYVMYNEVVSLPNNVMAFGRPRSSLNRSGVTIHTAVWDAGYSGRSTSLLSVLNPAGFRVQIGARVLQLVFVGLAQTAQRGYQGIYQGENVR
jgi:dUTP pyrophosphatase